MPEWKTPTKFITGKDPNILKEITVISLPEFLKEIARIPFRR
jgi:hypothetical protein